MKYMNYSQSNLFIYFLVGYIAASSFAVSTALHFVIVIPSYNNKDWYQKNLDSVLIQTYKNYDVVYVNDCSTDDTDDLVSAYIKKYCAQKIITKVNNKKRVGALANIYRVVHACNDDDVIVLLDGDDWLAHENVLLRLSEVYTRKENWVVYSQFTQWPYNMIGWNKAFSKRVYQGTDTPRNYAPSHLRTFYAGLFKRIKLEDLLYEGDFFAMTWDKAIMLPMVEMASDGHVEFVPEVLYIYNHSNPISDHNIDLALQQKLDSIIVNKKKYAPLKSIKEAQK
jgi:glycosyltransferase involved in cell wall biosynthesis